jgi:hypothetical protein
MTLVCPQYTEYEITNKSLVFIGEFRAWSVSRTESSFRPEDKFLKWIDRLRLTLSVDFGTYWERWQPKSTDQWDAALGLADSCVEKFQHPVASFQDIEERANGALDLLTKR